MRVSTEQIKEFATRFFDEKFINPKALRRPLYLFETPQTKRARETLEVLQREHSQRVEFLSQRYPDPTVLEQEVARLLWGYMIPLPQLQSDAIRRRAMAEFRGWEAMTHIAEFQDMQKVPYVATAADLEILRLPATELLGAILAALQWPDRIDKALWKKQGTLWRPRNSEGSIGYLACPSWEISLVLYAWFQVSHRKDFPKTGLIKHLSDGEERNYRDQVTLIMISIALKAWRLGSRSVKLPLQLLFTKARLPKSDSVYAHMFSYLLMELPQMRFPVYLNNKTYYLRLFDYVVPDEEETRRRIMSKLFAGEYTDCSTAPETVGSFIRALRDPDYPVRFLEFRGGGLFHLLSTHSHTDVPTKYAPASVQDRLEAAQYDADQEAGSRTAYMDGSLAILLHLIQLERMRGEHQIKTTIHDLASQCNVLLREKHLRKAQAKKAQKKGYQLNWGNVYDGVIRDLTEAVHLLRCSFNAAELNASRAKFARMSGDLLRKMTVVIHL